MEYTVIKLARLAGISTRTLRYYDEIGLLHPARINTSGYRIYGEKEVDLLQQILFYRELGMGLSEIAGTIQNPEFDRLNVLQNHLLMLQKEQLQLSLLIQTVKKTIKHEEGKQKMSDKEKFEGLKCSMLRENEEKYGKEIREKYGKDIVENSNRKWNNLTEKEFNEMQDMAADIIASLESAVQADRNPKDEYGKIITEIHKKWLSYTWQEYTVEAHTGLVQMYVEDERFRKYYDSNISGCAEYLKEAVEHWAGKI